jgi:Protein of unknown function (DUF2933)
MKEQRHERPESGISRTTWVLIGFLAVAAYFLLSEHRAHFIQFLPFLLLLACPLMHFFHGHGGHGGHEEQRRNEPEKQAGQRRPRSEGDSQ